jgi:hypothetical protein
LLVAPTDKEKKKRFKNGPLEAGDVETVLARATRFWNSLRADIPENRRL